ncbi:MAG: TIM-barrel domain-containing protein [Planctomycetota bacterium]|jgi:alpha-glucosidase (family GH31 glycosyl hydrolase)
MKKPVQNSLVISLLLILPSVSFSQVNLKYFGSENYVSFEIINENLKGTFCITAENTGCIFYETSEGRVYLSGQPLNTKKIKNGFHGCWQDSNARNIQILITPKDNNYYISFSAEPSCDIIKWGLSIKVCPDEFFTGCFERVIDGSQELSWQKGIKQALDLRDQTVEMSIKPSLSLYCPFYISSNGYGLFTEGTWPGSYDFCKSEPNLVQISFEGENLKLTLYTNKHPAKIISDHSLYVGPSIVPPRWAFSCWRWRDNHTNRTTYYDGTVVTAPYNSELVEDILMMQALDIPCSVYWVDRPWAVGKKGYSDFEWDTNRLPNPEKMINWLDKKNIRFLLWIAPWIDGQITKTVLKKGYCLNGQNNKHIRPLIDFTNPDAKTWWQNHLAKLLKAGVAGFKLDRSEEKTSALRNRFAYDGRTTRQMRNDYPVQYIQATNEICKKIRGDDFVLLARAGYTNSSRSGTFWGGDSGSSPEALRAAIIAVQRCSVIGFALWGSDTGGYWHGNLDRQVCARWLAFSCFCPIMEVGPTQDRAFWDMKNPPHYDTELIAVWRLYAKLHTNLADYTYDCAKTANKTGMPIVRPLFMVYPQDKQSWKDWQTFLYGSDILVSAIWQENKQQHTLYLPGGQDWVDAWQPTRVYKGGRQITIDTPFYKIPIFVKKDAKIIKAFGNLEQLYQQSLTIAQNKPDLKQLEKSIQ